VFQATWQQCLRREIHLHFREQPWICLFLLLQRRIIVCQAITHTLLQKSEEQGITCAPFEDQHAKRNVEEKSTYFFEAHICIAACHLKGKTAQVVRQYKNFKLGDQKLPLTVAQAAFATFQFEVEVRGLRGKTLVDTFWPSCISFSMLC